MRYGFKDVTSEYIGGGIWIYMGQLTNGNYFMCSDDAVNVINADPREAGEDAYYMDWQIEHTVDLGREIDLKEFQTEMWDWIKANKPDEFDPEMVWF